MSTLLKLTLLGGVLACAFTLAGCISNPDAPSAGSTATTQSTPGNVGEPPAPKPTRPASQRPADVQSTSVGALSLFAQRYVNWSYRTLTADQQTLARMAVGAARLAEQQAAAASTTDATITHGQVWNHGQIISIAPDRTHSGQWVIVTREQTGGTSDYQGLPAAYHVTLAQLTPTPGGYAISQWQPQS